MEAGWLKTLTNATVILLLLVTFVLAGLVVVPAKTPVGRLTGEFANHRFLIEGMSVSE